MTATGSPPSRLAHSLHGPAVMAQTWSSIVWCHWPVPPEAVAARLPAGLEPDLHDGAAWVGLVPFEMRDLRVVAGGRRLPAVPGTESFSGGILGFDLRTGQVVDLDTLIFDLGGTTFYGESSTSGGETALLDLAGAQNGYHDGSSETYSATSLTLDPAGAAYLDSALRTTAFVAGTVVGSFTAAWVD